MRGACQHASHLGAPQRRQTPLPDDLPRGTFGGITAMYDMNWRQLPRLPHISLYKDFIKNGTPKKVY